MNDWYSGAVLLGDQERFRALSQNFRGGRAELSLSECLLGLACLAATVLAVWIVAQLLSRPAEKRTIHHPRRLFRDLCRAHAIGFWDRRKLWQLARSGGLPQPAVIFVRPDLLDARLSGKSSRRQQARYAELRGKLFGTPGSLGDSA